MYSKAFVRLYNIYCSGIFTGNTDASDEQLFVCEQKTLFRLFAGLSQACDQCQSYSRKPTTFRQVFLMINPSTWCYAMLFFRTGMSSDSNSSVDDVEDVSGGLAREHLVDDTLSIKSE